MDMHYGSFLIGERVTVASIGSSAVPGKFFFIFIEATGKQWGGQFLTLQAAVDAIDAELGAPSAGKEGLEMPNT